MRKRIAPCVGCIGLTIRIVPAASQTFTGHFPSGALNSTLRDTYVEGGGAGKIARARRPVVVTINPSTNVVSAGAGLSRALIGGFDAQVDYTILR